MMVSYTEGNDIDIYDFKDLKYIISITLKKPVIFFLLSLLNHFSLFEKLQSIDLSKILILRYIPWK